jgi:hypothetical protein
MSNRQPARNPFGPIKILRKLLSSEFVEPGAELTGPMEFSANGAFSLSGMVVECNTSGKFCFSSLLPQVAGRLPRLVILKVLFTLKADGFF